MEIQAESALEAWKNLLLHVVQNGQQLRYRERGMIECLNVMTIVKASRRVEEPITLLNSLGKWVYPPLEEIEESLMSPDKNKDYIYNYGSRLFGSEINQVDGFLIPLLKEKADSGRGVLIAWNVAQDSRTSVREAPGVVAFDFKLRSGVLNVTTIIRNNDIFFGWPANIYHTHIMQKYVAGKLGARPGTLTTLSCSAHIYEDTLPYVKKVLGKKLQERLQSSRKN